MRGISARQNSWVMREILHQHQRGPNRRRPGIVVAMTLMPTKSMALLAAEEGWQSLGDEFAAALTFESGHG
jgi:hypothetical protein